MFGSNSPSGAGTCTMSRSLSRSVGEPRRILGRNGIRRDYRLGSRIPRSEANPSARLFDGEASPVHGRARARAGFVPLEDSRGARGVSAGRGRLRFCFTARVAQSRALSLHAASGSSASSRGGASVAGCSIDFHCARSGMPVAACFHASGALRQRAATLRYRLGSKRDFNAP